MIYYIIWKNNFLPDVKSFIEWYKEKYEDLLQSTNQSNDLLSESYWKEEGNFSGYTFIQAGDTRKEEDVRRTLQDILTKARRAISVQGVTINILAALYHIFNLILNTIEEQELTNATLELSTSTESMVRLEKIDDDTYLLQILKTYYENEDEEVEKVDNEWVTLAQFTATRGESFKQVVNENTLLNFVNSKKEKIISFFKNQQKLRLIYIASIQKPFEKIPGGILKGLFSSSCLRCGGKKN